MIDFNNANAFFAKLKLVRNEIFFSQVAPFFVSGEYIVSCFQGIRDGVVFTNKRIISINVQGVTGKKRDYTTLPYSKIQAYSVETAGVLDTDSELDLWFSGLGKVRFEFTSKTNITEICKVISGYVL